MWSFLRLRFAPPAALARSEEQAIGYLQDLYRIAYFLLGSRLGAEKLVQAAYQKVWRQHSRGERVGNWRLSLLQALLDVAKSPQFRGVEPGREEAPPLWEALSRLDLGARAVILLDALDLPVKQIAWVVKAPETLTSQRLEAARDDFWNGCRDE